MKTDYFSEIKNGNFPTRFLDISNQFHSKTAYAFLGTDGTVSDQFTFGELRQKSISISNLLQTLSTNHPPIILAYPTSVHFLPAFLGCALSTIIAVPVNLPSHENRFERLACIIKDTGSKTILTVSSHSDLIKKGLAGLDIQVIATDTIPLTDQPLLTPPVIENPILHLQYTSGLTGTPKGVVINNANLMHNLACQVDRAEFTPDSVVVSWLPHYHDMGLVGPLLQSMVLGWSLVAMAPSTFLQRPVTWFEAISHNKATHSPSPQFGFSYLTQKVSKEQCVGMDFSSIITFFNGAEPIQVQALQTFVDKFQEFGISKSQLFPCYGMAETTLIATGGPVGSGLNTTYCASLQKEFILCGQPVPGLSITIVDPNTETECEPGEVGEICVSGPSVSPGYWGNSDTIETVLKTGDLGFLVKEGLAVTGRIKDLIIVRGRNIYPTDIEWAITEMGDPIKGAAAFSLSGINGETAGVVVEISRKLRKQLDSSELLEKIRSQVLEHVDLSLETIAFVVEGRLSRTTSGKLRRFHVRELLLNNELDTLYRWDATVLPPTQTWDQITEVRVEQWLTHKIAELTGLNPLTVSIDSPFSELGLTSPAAVDLTQQLSELTGLQLEAFLLYEYPTIRSVSEFVANESLKS